MGARPNHVEIRASDSLTLAKVPLGKLLQELAMRWNYIVRQRHRWANEATGRERQSERLQADLLRLGIKANTLRRIAQCGIVEVSIPFRTEEEGWEARIAPWEYILTAATAEYRGDQKLLVVRHLNRSRRSPKRRPLQTLAIVDAAPGCLRESCDFSAQKRLIQSVVTESSADEILDPTCDGLQQFLQACQPDVLHWTGCDASHAHRMLAGSDVRKRSMDGVFLSGESGEPLEVTAVELARLITANDSPELIGFHLWDSGARLAALSVACGVNAAVGFEHTVDSAVAEQFFVHFYRACIAHDLNYLTAFLVAWNALAPYAESVRGSSIILWSARSLVGADYVGFERLADRAQAARTRQAKRALLARDADPRHDRAADLLEVSVQPKRQLNYSLLHNGGWLLDEFAIRFVRQLTVSREAEEPASAEAEAVEQDVPVGQIRDVHVTVELHVGKDSYPYRTSLKLGQASERVDLARSVRLPLTSAMFRQINERTLTSLYAEVRWHDQVVYRDTHPVWLSPIDEWSLLEDDICWLPSFVQPRDRAVAATIAAAQGYLQCLADTGEAGFDGYQSYAPLDRRDKWGGVDRQVRAIWSALVFASRLHYINPPPSYTAASQRLRTPCQTIEQTRGTCIDLSLLLASCLEWVEIYPVIFLLHGHAFPGYWKNPEAYRKFFDVRAEIGGDAEVEIDSSATSGVRWIADHTNYREIKHFVEQGDLIPLESVYLTSGRGYQAAVLAGRDHFARRHSGDFHSMVDIFSAREVVTPLPLEYER